MEATIEIFEGAAIQIMQLKNLKVFDDSWKGILFKKDRRKDEKNLRQVLGCKGLL